MSKGLARLICICQAVILPLVLGATAVQAQSTQQDRRIEEEKRDSLKATTVTPPLPSAPASLTSPPVPQPLKEFYFISLLPKRVTFRYDAAKAIVILTGVDEDYIDLSSQVAYLQDNGFFPRRFRKTFDPMQPLRRGLAAYMFHRALRIQGGIAWHLFGPTERYALKELVFRGVMAHGHVNDLISGEELVQIASQVAQRKVKQLPSPVP